MQTSDRWNTKCNESEILLSSKTNTERVHKLDRRRRRLTRDRWKHRELLPLGAYNTCLATLALFSISVCFKIQIQVHEHNDDGEDDQQALMVNYNTCGHWSSVMFSILSRSDILLLGNSCHMLNISFVFLKENKLQSTQVKIMTYLSTTDQESSNSNSIIVYIYTHTVGLGIRANCYLSNILCCGHSVFYIHDVLCFVLCFVHP